MGHRTDCNNYRGILLLSTAYWISSNILLTSGNYWESWLWIWTQQVIYWSHILHSWNVWEKMVIKWSSASAVSRLQESSW